MKGIEKKKREEKRRLGGQLSLGACQKKTSKLMNFKKCITFDLFCIK